MRAFPRGAGGVILSALLAVGCGSKASVTGKVTYEGEPVTCGGLVVFFDADGGSTYDRTELQTDGSFRISGLLPGSKKVSAAASRPYVPPMKGVDIPQEDLAFPDIALGNGEVVILNPGPNTVNLD